MLYRRIRCAGDWTCCDGVIDERGDKADALLAAFFLIIILVIMYVF